MKTDKAFDQKIELWDKSNPNLLAISNICWSDLKDAAIFVNDTLGLCLASAQSNFGESVTLETVLAIYDRILDRVEANQAQDKS